MHITVNFHSSSQFMVGIYEDISSHLAISWRPYSSWFSVIYYSLTLPSLDNPALLSSVLLLLFSYLLITLLFLVWCYLLSSHLVISWWPCFFGFSVTSLTWSSLDNPALLGSVSSINYLSLLYSKPVHLLSQFCSVKRWFIFHTYLEWGSCDGCLTVSLQKTSVAALC